MHSAHSTSRAEVLRPEIRRETVTIGRYALAQAIDNLVSAAIRCEAAHMTDDDGHLIEAGFDSEEAALWKAEAWQASRDWSDKQPIGTTVAHRGRQRLTANVLLDVPSGRSWFVSRKKGEGWEVEEHRVAAKVIGTDTLNAKDDLRMHYCGGEGELMRHRRSLADQGLFDRGVEA